MSRNKTEDIFTDTKPCTKCGAETVIIDIFPKGLCPQCAMAEMNKLPLSQIPKPNFAKTVRVK